MERSTTPPIRDAVLAALEPRMPPNGEEMHASLQMTPEKVKRMQLNRLKGALH